jgi:hypothetical protein
VKAEPVLEVANNIFFKLFHEEKSAMQTLGMGVFRVQDGETVSFDARSTGASTLFGVTASLSGQTIPVVAGQPIRVRLDKSQAQDPSFIPGAKSTNVTLMFSFTSESGGRYDITLSGDAGGDSDSSAAEQVGNLPQAIVYIFHIA